MTAALPPAARQRPAPDTAGHSPRLARRLLIGYVLTALLLIATACVLIDRDYQSEMASQNARQAAAHELEQQILATLGATPGAARLIDSLHSATPTPAEALASYRTQRNRLVAGSGVLLGMLAFMLWIIYRDSQRREADQQELAEINASLEDRVRQRTAELEQSNRDLVGFSYSISHDLRAPLRAINGFSHALLEDAGEQLDEQGRDHLGRIMRASLRMGELIDELLNLANVLRRPLNIKTVSLTALANDVFAELRITDPERQAELHVQDEMFAEGDESLLRNAISNLLHNAWKFTQQSWPTYISITAESTPEFMRYTVADNGVGFDMAHAKRLFQPFQQLHADQGYGGMGIGLASVRRIIERHGGSIQAESSPGEGARFIFTLPHKVAVVRRRRGRDVTAPDALS
ncbi:MAG: ATP-binding protein [Rhodocyclaceae bacterium]